jgi:hypothetical protein
LPEALARSHNDHVLSRSARRPQRGARPSFAQAILRRLMSRPSRTIAGAALAAVMTGIIINAMLLQHSHRLALTPPPSSVKASEAPSPAPAASATNASAGGETSSAPVTPPARPADLGALIESTTGSTHSSDPIRDLLRSDSGNKDGEAKKLTIAAQTALIKLGYAIKADGVVGASTQQAIQQFERQHNLTPSGDITPKLVKQLNAAAASASAR